MKRPFISVVVPVFGTGFDANYFYNELNEALSSWAEFELIFINDNHHDDNWLSIIKTEKSYTNVLGVCNGTNKGQHYSTKIGLKRAKGDYIVVSDCDGQDNPFEIKKMYEKLDSDSRDIVFGQRVNRKDNIINKLFSKLFYLLIYLISGMRYDEKTTSFSVAKSFLIKSILCVDNQKIIYGISIRKVTNNIGYTEVCHRNRRKGKSSYSFYSKVKLALEVINLCLKKNGTKASAFRK